MSLYLTKRCKLRQLTNGNFYNDLSLTDVDETQLKLIIYNRQRQIRLFVSLNADVAASIL